MRTFTPSIATPCGVTRRRWRSSLSEPNWVGSGELVDVNVDIVTDSGHEHGVLKPNELESACERPYNLWNYGEVEDIVSLAVTLLSGIVHNHPFIDGNKRTALIAARALLRRNGFDLDFPNEIELGELIRDFAAGLLAEEDLEEAFERYLVSLE